MKSFLFEIAWEVANKVGGIYTVIKTKVPVTVKEYQNNYILIGPLNHECAAQQVEVINHSLLPPVLFTVVNRMITHGVNVVVGKWLIEGAPLVVLFDLDSVRHRTSEWKHDFKMISGITINSFEMEQALLFGYCVSWFLGEYANESKKHMLIAQFHEWQSALALFLMHNRKLPIATIFTTHATLLGRHLCAASTDFYNNLHRFNVDFEAGTRGIYELYCLERGAANVADVFTTVSHITAYESEWLLKRRPDGVVPNGLNVIQFSAMHEFQNLHAQHKIKLHDFVRGHFYGHFDFDLDNTLYFFTSGRYEFRNKGVDMFLESLARLNARLKYINSNITVVAFIIMPAANNGYTVEALKGQAVIKQMNDAVEQIKNNIGSRIFDSCIRGQLPKSDTLLQDSEIITLKRRIYSSHRSSLPPVVTHNMADNVFDPILNSIRRLNLINMRDDRVKIVFHPDFLKESNPLFGLDYEEFVRGCHLGVFPSYYEPWGYTPAECTVMGVPSITTNLSGFGCFMEDTLESPGDYGIYIIDRRMKSIEESIEQLTDVMFGFCQKSRRQRITMRNRTERLSEVLDWKRMGVEYVKARRLAMRRKFGHANRMGRTYLQDGIVIAPNSDLDTETDNPGTASSIDEDEGEHVHNQDHEPSKQTNNNSSKIVQSERIVTSTINQKSDQVESNNHPASKSPTKSKLEPVQVLEPQRDLIKTQNIAGNMSNLSLSTIIDDHAHLSTTSKRQEYNAIEGSVDCEDTTDQDDEDNSDEETNESGSPLSPLTMDASHKKIPQPKSVPTSPKFRQMIMTKDRDMKSLMMTPSAVTSPEYSEKQQDKVSKKN